MKPTLLGLEESAATAEDANHWVMLYTAIVMANRQHDKVACPSQKGASVIDLQGWLEKSHYTISCNSCAFKYDVDFRAVIREMSHGEKNNGSKQEKGNGGTVSVTTGEATKVEPESEGGGS
jgi:hypothetical protein